MKIIKLTVCSLAVLLATSSTVYSASKKMSKKERNEIIGGTVGGAAVVGAAGITYGVLKKKADALGLSISEYLKVNQKAVRAGKSVDEYLDDGARLTGLNRNNYAQGSANGLSDKEMSNRQDQWLSDNYKVPRDELKAAREEGDTGEDVTNEVGITRRYKIPFSKATEIYRKGKDANVGEDASDQFYKTSLKSSEEYGSDLRLGKLSRKVGYGATSEDKAANRLNRLRSEVRNSASDAEESRTQKAIKATIKSMKEDGENQEDIDAAVRKISDEGQLRKEKFKPLGDKIDEEDEHSDEDYDSEDEFDDTGKVVESGNPADQEIDAGEKAARKLAGKTDSLDGDGSTFAGDVADEL